jgi:hypothetical protein
MAGVREEVGESTAVLLERGGSFFVYDPSLGIIASDGTVEGAYRRFTNAKRASVDDAERAGLALRRSVVALPLVPVRPRRDTPGRRSVVGELSLFVAKLCISFLIVGGIGVVVAMTAGRGGKSLGMADIADKAGEIARDVSGLPPEKKELLRQSVGVVSRELGPVFDAWRGPPPQ